MSNNFLAPKCPFCGIKMDFIDTNVSFDDYDVNWRQCWYRCPHCLIPSPMCVTESDAYIAATKRKQESNYILSISELLNIASKNFNGLLALDQEDVVWIECRDGNNGYVTVTNAERYDYTSKFYLYDLLWFDFSSINDRSTLKCSLNNHTYGLFWRCWYKTPTYAEQREIRWESVTKNER